MDLSQTIAELESLKHLLTPEELAEYERLSIATAEDIEIDWKTWYGTIYENDSHGNFIDSLDSIETDDRHHSEALTWHWDARTALLKGGRPPNDWFSYFPIWARGGNKTGIARRMVICDACLSVNAGQPGYTLYIGGNKEKTRKTAETIHSFLESPKIRQFYPRLSQMRKNKRGVVSGWRLDYIHTFAEHIFEFVSIEEGMAGANIEDRRITMMVFDDIDDRDDSVVIAERKFKLLTSEILPMGQASKTLVFFAQNLISRYSVMYQIQTQRQRVMTDRKSTKPIPAVRHLVTEPKTIDGIVRDVIVSGKPTWRARTLQNEQDELNRMGLPAYLRECQHDVEESKEGLALQHWNDAVHVITRSEFERKIGVRDIPQRWNKYNAHDWARTKTKFHANVDFSLAVSAQNSTLPGAYFVFNPYSFKAGCSPEDVAERILTGIAPKVRLNDGSWSTWKDLFESILKRSELESHRLSLTELIEARRNTFAQVIPKYVEPILRTQNWLVFRGSHEQSKTGALAVYQKVFGLNFQPTNPGADGGVNALNLAQMVDYNLDHPFAEWCEACQKMSRFILNGACYQCRGLTNLNFSNKGYTRFFLIVDDDKAEYLDALASDDLVDSDLFRFQMKNWRWRDSFLTSQGEMEGQLLKLHDDFGNACFVGDTLITTKDGPKRIDNIKVGDLVLTRKGYRSVVAAAPTGTLPVFEVTFSNGSRIIGTADHPVWVRGIGWKRLITLSHNDILYEWRSDQKSLSSKARSFTDILTRNMKRIGSIFSRTSRGEKRASGRYTWKSGNPFMVTYRRVMRSITKTDRRWTTRLRILNCFPNPHTKVSTSNSGGKRTVKRDWLTWIGYARSLKSSIKAKEGKSRLRPCLNVLVNNGASEGRQLSHVNAVVFHFYLEAQGSIIVPVPVGSGTEICALKPRRDGALSADKNSALTSNLKAGFVRPRVGLENFAAFSRTLQRVHGAVRRLRGLVNAKNSAPPVAVVSVRPVGMRQVFNLQVEDQPEYFANGVLVHNCMMLFHDNLLQAAPLTHEEQVEVVTAPGFTRDELQRRSDLSMEQKALNEWFARGLAEKALDNQPTLFDEWGQKMPTGKSRRWATAQLPIDFD